MTIYKKGSVPRLTVRQFLKALVTLRFMEPGKVSHFIASEGIIIRFTKLSAAWKHRGAPSLDISVWSWFDITVQPVWPIIRNNCNPKYEDTSNDTYPALCALYREINHRELMGIRIED